MASLHGMFSVSQHVDILNKSQEMDTLVDQGHIPSSCSLPSQYPDAVDREALFFSPQVHLEVWAL